MSTTPIPLDAAPLAICVAPNGARRTRADHPALPIEPDEIARAAAEAAEAGAAMIHLHVRDRDEAHVLDPDGFRAASAAVRAAVGDRMVIQATTEAVGRYTPPEQMAFVRDLKPEAVSLALAELAPDEDTEAPASAFFSWVAGQGILTQYILYTPQDAARLRRMVLSGLIPQERPDVLFVLGRYAERQRGDPAELLAFVHEWGNSGPWSVCCFGPAETRAGLLACGLGGHMRVGFENNLHMADGTPAPDNAALVRRIADIARLAGRPVAGADWLRAARGCA